MTVAEWVPGPGFSSHAQTGDISVLYRGLGPFPQGSIVEEVGVVINVGAGQTVRIAPTLSMSRDESATGLAAGRPICQHTIRLIGATPAVEMIFPAAGMLALTFPVGVLVHGGPSYVVFGWQTTGAVATDVFFWAKLLSLLGA